MLIDRAQSVIPVSDDEGLGASHQQERRELFVMSDLVKRVFYLVIADAEGRKLRRSQNVFGLEM